MANSKIIKLWFKIAIRDLKNSKALIDLGTIHKHAAAYHAQQCAEKAIKGFLTHHNCRVFKTHDLEELAKLVMQFDKPLLDFTDLTTRISRSLTTLEVVCGPKGRCLFFMPGFFCQ